MGKVSIVRADPDIIVANVIGDSGKLYQTVVERQDPSSRAVTFWTCECLWGNYAWGPVHKGRMCSHALAALYEVQSREYRKTAPDYGWSEVDVEALGL